MGGGIASGSNMQRLNPLSSTEAKLVASDDFLSKILWVQNFLQHQGIILKRNTLLQDNKSAILMEMKGRKVLGKWSRAINVRYFAIKDACNRGELDVEYCPTDEMLGDVLTKPLQGSKFVKFRNAIMGCSDAECINHKLLCERRMANRPNG